MMRKLQGSAAAVAIAAFTMATAQQPAAGMPGVPDQRQLTALACSGVGAEDAEALKRIQDGRIEVQCRAHRTLHSVPLARHTLCEKRGGTWRCEGGEDVLLMEPRPGSRVAVTGEGLPVRALIELVRESARLTYLPFHNPASWLMRDRCHVRPAEGSTFQGGALFEIDCTPGALAVTRDCWNNRCRYFVTSGREYTSVGARGGSP